MPRIHTLSDIVFVSAPDMAVTSSTNGTGVNCLGYSSAMVTLTASTSGGCTVACTLQDSPDNSNWTAVGTIGTIPASSTKYPLTASVNLKNRQQYIRVVYVVTGSVTAGVNCNVELTNPQAFPVIQTNGTVYL